MVRTHARWRDRGQATVEHVGLTLIIALLLAACAAWAVHEVRPPAHVPDVIGKVAAPLDDLAARLGVPGVSAAPSSGAGRVENGQPGVIRRAWNAFVSWGTLNVDGEGQALGGFIDELRSQVSNALRDPLGTGARILGMVRGAPAPMPEVDESAPTGPGVVGYLFDIGKRPLRETFLHMSRVAGHWAFDWVVARGARWLRLRLPEYVTGP